MNIQIGIRIIVKIARLIKIFSLDGVSPVGEVHLPKSKISESQATKIMTDNIPVHRTRNIRSHLGKIIFSFSSVFSVIPT